MVNVIDHELPWGSSAMRTVLARSGLVLLIVLIGSGSRTAEPAPIDFSRQIAPLLQNHCLACHSGIKARSGLRLETRALAIKGGYSGPALVPGKSQSSRLMKMVSSTSDEVPVMPPKGGRLSACKIQLIEDWIDQGAKWPAEVVLTNPAIKQEPVKHWAFQALVRPALPVIRQKDWARNGIDHFVLKRLEGEGITPSPEADRAALLRRVTLDLIGLPPSPEEVAAFINDTRVDAYERAVDRLLASPHYGERWARPWLDLCHFGDTDGYLTDQLRPVAWRYRQWLIEALNRDLPFDRFTIEQLAGDLLPDATMDQKLATGFLRNTLSNREGGADLEQYRVEQVVDRVALVSTGWMGLTVGCARCHDHKFDPISQREFYQLYAFFDDADEVNLNAPLTGEMAPYLAGRPEYQKKRAEVLQPVLQGLTDLQGRWEKRLLEAAANPGVDATWDRQWEVLGLIWGGNLGEGQLEGCQLVQLGPSKRTTEEAERLQEYFLRHGAIIDGKRFNELKLADYLKKLDALEKERPKVTRAPAMRKAAVPRKTHMHVRGDFRVPGIAVEANTPGVLPPLPATKNPSRLDLANWLVSPDNPLPDRTLVNRAWQEFFGKAFARTTDDFGARGDRPSHPELLDHLAMVFRDRGRSMKALHAYIVTSATYRQSSRARSELVTRDPDNRLLARQASLRLSADQVRDSALAVSGLLDAKVGGPSVFPQQPASVAMEGFRNKWEESTGRDRYRRGLYTYLQRLSPFAQNVTFDAPATSAICTRRERSNTPLQALTLLNDPVFVEAARALGVRVLREVPSGWDKRINHLFHLALSRSASSQESAVLARYLVDQRARLAGRAIAHAPHETTGVDPVEGAAWTGLCSIVMNLHEFITRD